MLSRLFQRSVRPASLALGLVLSTLPLATSGLAAEQIVDNSDGVVSIKGKWTVTSTTGGFIGADYLFRTPGDGASSVTWPYPSGSAGRFEVFAQWAGGPNRATNATYQVTSNAGQTSVAVNQKINGGSWQSLGTFDFQPGKGQGVMLTDKGDGVVVADAVRFVATADAPAAITQSAAASPPPAQDDARTFRQTGYRIGDDAFWNYFNVRGGVRTFGYPVSNVFMLFGMRVQIFQRQVLQLRPDGGVQTMNLLDEGMLPYTRINGSTFPAPDPAVIARSPKPDAPDYLAQTLDFVRSMAPDSFEGEPVNFAKTFFGTVSAADAFPNGAPDGGEGLLAYFNLEIWGLPTSKPARDPTNPDFIYQRFQRGIMHYNRGCACTQGLLLADLVKSLLTGRNLPTDLAEQASSSKLIGQFKPGQPQSLARPGDLPGSDLSNSFRRDASVTLDAGHGGTEIGTSHTFADGTILAEKDLNLRVMLRVRDLLQQGGFQVATTRTRDSQVNTDKRDLTGDGKVTLSDDLQARVDFANNNASDIFVSIHFNGISEPNVKGTYVFFDPDRPFADRSKALAELVDKELAGSLKAAGYTTVDHGATKDTSILGGNHYYLLSPRTAVVPRPSQMPAIIGEGLFLTNADDANAAAKDAIVEAVARGYVEGIKDYFARFPVS
ncbi:MAG: N-acetylmuramoyl-L-alanine amidase [Chloroflexota bacterium]|nr:N-acetylmuramoyl-L-alanine amidase [Chloroflexota bacterium]